MDLEGVIRNALFVEEDVEVVTLLHLVEVQQLQGETVLVLPSAGELFAGVVDQAGLGGDVALDFLFTHRDELLTSHMLDEHDLGLSVFWLLDTEVFSFVSRVYFDLAFCQ